MCGQICEASGPQHGCCQDWYTGAPGALSWAAAGEEEWVMGIIGQEWEASEHPCFMVTTSIPAGV